jgi:hypothetical protein
MNQSLVESIYGRSSMQPANIVPIRLQTWPPKALIVSGLSISKNILFTSPSSFRGEDF